MPAPKDDWLDQEAGPFVRPYAVTKGRTAPAKGRSIGLIDMVVTAPGAQPPAGLGLGPGTGRCWPGAAGPSPSRT